MKLPALLSTIKIDVKKFKASPSPQHYIIRVHFLSLINSKILRPFNYPFRHELFILLFLFHTYTIYGVRHVNCLLFILKNLVNNDNIES